MSRTNRPREATGQHRQRPRPTSPDMTKMTVAPFATGDEADTENHDSSTADPRFAQLRQLYAIIADVGAALNISPARLAEGEALERLEVVTRLTVDQLARCDANRVQEWFAALADDLALEVRLDGLDPDMPAVAASLRVDKDPAGALRAFQAAAQSATETQGDDISVEARLSAGKARALALAQEIARQRPGIAAPGVVAVFYTADAWNQLISLAAIPYLEQSGLIRADSRTCVLLCDTPGYLAGALLECIGAALPAQPDWLAVSPAAFRQFAAREEASRRLLADEGGWPDAPRILTPEMLHLLARAPGLEKTNARLAHLRAELAATALASVAQGKVTEGLTLRFAGARPATCVLSATNDNTNTNLSATGAALARLAEWATRRGTVDTLIIARECLARELPAGRVLTLADVEQAAVDALEAAKANFTLFVRGQTDRYFAARQTAQEAVDNYAEAVRKTVSDLTSDVVDNVYRTVGLLAAVVIAGLIQPPSSPVLALVASILYTGYIAFIVYFLLRARDDHFTLEQAALTARLAEMSELTTAERQRIRKPATSADAYFRRYMARTRRIYIALMALGIVCAIIVLIVALAIR
jgi:hypothetical protein